MNDVYWFLLLGHLLGDYVFQNDWMAQNKKKPGFIGKIAAYVHCMIYTIIIYLILNAANFELFKTSIFINHFLFMSSIFLSHWIFDRYRLVERWMDFFGTRSWYTSLPWDLPDDFGNERIYKKYDHINWNKETDIKTTVSTSFGAFVYIMVDNTFHLVLMTLIISLFK